MKKVRWRVKYPASVCTRDMHISYTGEVLFDTREEALAFAETKRFCMRGPTTISKVRNTKRKP